MIAPRKTGRAAITVTATDRGALAATQRFEVTVSNRNRAPTAEGAIPELPLVAGGAAHTVDVAGYFSDPDGDTLTYRATTSNESVATVSTDRSRMTVTPRKTGRAAITVTATDPGRLTAEQRFEVTVTNQAPTKQGTIAVPPLVVGVAHRADVAPFFSDPDGHALSYAATSSDESVATVSTDRSRMTVTPRKTGRAAITVTATDPGRLTAEQRFEVTVTNQAPVNQGTIPVVPLVVGGFAYTVDVASYFTTPDRRLLSYVADSSDRNVATVSMEGSRLTITPVKVGTAKITVTATDDDRLTATQEFEVTVSNREPAAQGVISVPALVIGTPHTVDVASYFTDPDGHPLSYAAQSSDTKVATVRTDGSAVTITPVKVGRAKITVTATDPGRLTAEQRFEATVSNRAPAAQGTISLSPLVVGGSPGTVDVALYFTDPDGDPLSYAAQSSDTKVAAAGIGGSTLTVTAVAPGTAEITMTATDPGRLTAEQRFEVTVSNRAPTAQGTISLSPLAVGGSPGTVDVALYFTDPDGDPLSYAAQSSDTKVATAGIGGSTLTITPVAAGAAEITVTATDPGTLREKQRFPVTVQAPVQSPPVTDRSVPLELQSLTITGVSGSPYPAFAAGVLHYAVRCGSSTTLRVQAQSRRAGAGVTLLRADSTANQSATGSLDAWVTVSGDHDVAIRLSDGGATKTYVVHCIPDDFPDVTILKKTASVSDGLLFVLPHYYYGSDAFAYWAILDNHGVPRFHRKGGGINFRRHADGRYSVSKRSVVLFDRLDQQLTGRENVGVVAPLSHTDGHDFLITDAGTYLFISYHPTTHDLCEAPQQPCPTDFSDSIIQEVTPEGTEVFRWNSWDHMKLTDCMVYGADYAKDYAHLNSLQVVDGDIIASFRHCNQVVRIDRSGKTGTIEWQLGGTAPPRDPATSFLPITGDRTGDGEFCGQHHATLTAAGTVVLFDNGVHCKGRRKNQRAFSRVVEYDISSGTQAVYRREFRLPGGHGYAFTGGGVTVLKNGHWLIAWGSGRRGITVRNEEVIMVSEFDPGTGTSLFEMNVFRPFGTGDNRQRRAWTYRAYREHEADVNIPLNLP